MKNKLIFLLLVGLLNIGFAADPTPPAAPSTVPKLGATSLYWSDGISVPGKLSPAIIDGTESEPRPVFDYVYRAVIVKIVDGDTVLVNIDLGFKTWIHNISLRLSRVYAPEIFKPKDNTEKKQGMLVTGFVATRLQVGQETTIVTIKDKTEKYGRYLAEIWDQEGNLNNAIIQFMIDNKIESNKIK